MNIEKYRNFQEAYVKTINYVHKFGDIVKVRGNSMKEVIPYMFTIRNPRDRMLLLKARPKIYRYIFGELLWYLTGRDDLEFINNYSKVWQRLSDDGIHSNSAYGKYIFRPMCVKGEGVNYNKINILNSQWEHVKEVLKNDPCSRQAVIQIKPIQMYDTKDVTCTYNLQFFIRNDKLNMIANMRSNDLIYGTTFDIFMFTFLQELMAAELGIELGTYTHFAANIHYYYKDIDTIMQIIQDNELDVLTPQMPSIQSDFRIHDLPLLIVLENNYWKGFDYSEQYNSLSSLGKFLADLLIGG